MIALTNLPAFLLAAAAVIFVPGPATFFVAAKVQDGLRPAMLSVAGIIAGDVLLITLSGIGFGAFLAKTPMAVDIVKVVGALYLAYIGVELLRSKPSREKPGTSRTSDERASSFVKGLLITITNPKPILFFVAFFPMFIAPAGEAGFVSFYVLGGLFQTVNVVYFAMLIALVAMLGTWSVTDRFLKGGFNQVAGGILVVIAGLVLIETATAVMT